MITTWLGDTSLESFLAAHYRRTPCARPGTASGAAQYLSWQIIADILSGPTRPDVMIVRNGRLLDIPTPQGPAEFRNLFSSGCSFVLREAELHDPAIRAVADSFARELGGTVTVQIFGTPAGCQGFGWHYDCEEVFIAQTSGTKEYYLRENSVNPAPTIESIPADMQFEKETSPLIACTLDAGDLLYIPRGWWHMGKATDNSLGLSVGILTDEARGTLTRAESRVRGRHATMRGPVP